MEVIAKEAANDPLTQSFHEYKQIFQLQKEQKSTEVAFKGRDYHKNMLVGPRDSQPNVSESIS